VAFLLLGGNKQGKNNWYKKFITIADQLYEQHIKSLKGKNDG